MGHRRSTAPTHLLHGEPLTRAMAGIGMRFAVTPVKEPNVEDTLVAASIEGVEREELRVLAVLTTWIGIHRRWINVDRLTRAVAALESKAVRAYWAAVAAWMKKDGRFLRLSRTHFGKPMDLPGAGIAFQLKRRGEDPRFEGTCFRVPEGVLRDRESDVDPPEELARRHTAYRHRVLMGPSYRADMWAALSRDPSLAAAALARATYGSFATAWQVRRDFAILGAPREERCGEPHPTGTPRG